MEAGGPAGDVEHGLPSPVRKGRDGAPGMPIALVGLMGVGKTSVGRKLARALDLPFSDADDEIVRAAGMSIPDIFELYGEGAFRDLERRVVQRLLLEDTGVIALGGGAFVDATIRKAVRARAFSIWLRADLETLVSRVLRKRASRPLLMSDDPRHVLARLMNERYPVYAEADCVVDSDDRPVEVIVQRISDLLGRSCDRP